MARFVIYSNNNYFIPLVSKFTSPYIWADMTGHDTEPDESDELNMEMSPPTRVPDKKWSTFFEVEIEKRRQLEGQGILKNRYPAKEVTEKLLALPDSQKKNYIVVFDFNHGVDFGEKLLKAGFKGIFAQKWAFDLERKREKAGELVKKYYKNVKVPRQIKFGTNSSDKMVDFIEKNNTTVWVVKPNGEGIGVYCPNSDDGPIASEQAIDFIVTNKNEINKIPMILQEKVIGVEINIETAYSNGKPITAIVDLENKFLHTEETGHQCGCAFDLVFGVDLNCKLRKLCNEPFDKLAKKLNFTGCMDMNAIISYKDGAPYFLEFCPNRFGYNALYTEIELSGLAPDKFLEQFVNGKLKYPEGFASSIRLFNEDHSEDFYRSIFDPNFEEVEVQIKRGLDSVWVGDIHKVGSKYYLGHKEAETVVVTAKSDTPQGAIEKAKFKAERDIDFDGKYFRTDSDNYHHHHNPVFRYEFIRDHHLLEVDEDNN